MRKARPTDHRSHHSSTSTDTRVGTLLHATLGLTYGAGAGKAIAELISGK